MDDPAFDLRYHVRHIALPKPGTMRQLLDLASLIAVDPFDRTRPLWQFWIIDGIRGGKSALVQKMHHTIIDGEGGIQLSLEYLDFERDAPEPPPIVAVEEEPPAPSPNIIAEVMRSMISGGLKVPIGMVRQMRDVLADPTGPPQATLATAETVRNVLNQLGETDKARSPLWTERSLGRHVEVLRAPFGATRDAATAPRRHAQHRVRHRRRTGRRRVPRPPRRTRSTRCGRAWPSAPAPPRRARTRSPSGGCSCRPRRCRSPSASP